MKTEITELLGIEYPIIQGGMAWVAEDHLAAAVSNAGGLGIIGAANAPADWVREQVREAKKLTDKPFGDTRHDGRDKTNQQHYVKNTHNSSFASIKLFVDDSFVRSCETFAHAQN